MQPGEAMEILERTPGALRGLTAGLSSAWLAVGRADDWGPYEIVGHLIEGERTDWVPRARIMLEHGVSRPFEPFDREAQLRVAPRPLDVLLDELESLRTDNLKALAELPLDDLYVRGRHPELGEVTLGQLLAAWAVHDLSHVAQAAEAMARRWREEIGPWRAYLPVVDREPLPE